MQKTTTCLMFVGEMAGKAEEAMRFYTSLFTEARVVNMTRYKVDEPGGKAGMVRYAVFAVQGQEYAAMDSTAPHAFTFTPAVSIVVRCDGETEIDDLYQKLSDGGRVLMPLGHYGFSKKFGWINDSYGVSWQLNLP